MNFLNNKKLAIIFLLKTTDNYFVQRKKQGYKVVRYLILRIEFSHLYS
jgi:hypothetical protein